MGDGPETFGPIDNRVTSVTLDNVHVYRVGEILEALRDAGLTVEINICGRQAEGDHAG